MLRGAGGAGLAAALAACGTGTPAAPRQQATPDGRRTSRPPTRWSAGPTGPAYLDYDEKTKKYPTLEKFQQETGIKVDYAEDIDDNDRSTARSRASSTNGQDIGTDIIVLTDWMAARLIRQGYVQELNKANIPNVERT